MTRFFVTGATGFVGGALVRRLRAAGHQVVAVVRDVARASALSAQGVDVRRGDITDRASLVEPMRGVDGVFHVAAWYRVGASARERRTANAINVEGTRNVLQVMRELRIPRGVYTSTLGVFGDTHGRLVDENHRRDGPWLTEYDRTKWAAHYQVALPAMRAGLPLVIVQPGLVYGPGDTSALHDSWVRYLKRSLPALVRGTEYCWAHVEDVAAAHVLALERGRRGASYIVAGPRHSMVEAFGIAERITGVPAPRTVLSPGVVRAIAGVMGVVERVVPVPAAFTREGLIVTAGVTYLGNNERARRELGYAPRELEAGLRETLAWEMEQLGMTAPQR